MLSQAAFEQFQGLDERINFVATKVVHLGDQLEGVNTPRTRAAEAHQLMKYYKEFMVSNIPQSPIFTDPFQVRFLKSFFLHHISYSAGIICLNLIFDIDRKP